MTKPKYLVRITDKDVACRGIQLASIVQTIKPDIKDSVWYASDIDAITKPGSTIDFKNMIPQKVGYSGDLITLSMNVLQFLSGVFIAIPKDEGEKLKYKRGTEDPEFRDIGNAILEIRSFDTSYFVIYANSFDLLQKIANNFFGIIEYNLVSD